MENASKALVMAGGILVALLVIGALLLMLNQIGDYQRTQDSNKNDSQLAEFNLDFERYADNKGIKGVDIISLINKVNDYNKKSNNGGVPSSVDYNIKMSITVSGLDDFNNKYAYDSSSTNSLFSYNSYTFNSSNTTNNSIKQVLDLFKDFAEAESIGIGIGIDKLKIVSSVYDASKNESINKASITSKFQELGVTWNGNTPSLDTIKKYRQYSEFKSSTFKIDTTKRSNGIVYENGQIKDLYFKFDK